MAEYLDGNLAEVICSNSSEQARKETNYMKFLAVPYRL